MRSVLAMICHRLSHLFYRQHVRLRKHNAVGVALDLHVRRYYDPAYSPETRVLIYWTDGEGLDIGDWYIMRPQEASRLLMELEDVMATIREGAAA